MSEIPDWLSKPESAALGLPWNYWENVIVFGPQANCTLAVCPVKASVYTYRPSLVANGMFIALFSVAAIIHTYLGIRWRSWWFMNCMIIGCLGTVVGYIGRIMLWYNPWSFNGFMIQIVLIGTSPVLMCAAIYITLSKAVVYLGREYSRLPPKAYYWMFLPCDALALVLQAVGGALSTLSSGASKTGVNLGIAGLALQVATMFFFIVAFADYLIRYIRSGHAKFTTRLKVFFTGLSLATFLILARSAYRVEELNAGYNGPSMHDEGKFIALEGVLITLAAFALIPGHPGLVFERNIPTSGRGSIEGMESGAATQTEKKSSSSNDDSNLR